jgi:hypothetical protein
MDQCTSLHPCHPCSPMIVHIIFPPSYSTSPHSLLRFHPPNLLSTPHLSPPMWHNPSRHAHLPICALEFIIIRSGSSRTEVALEVLVSKFVFKVMQDLVMMRYGEFGNGAGRVKYV